jgi:hypothetical protein
MLNEVLYRLHKAEQDKALDRWPNILDSRCREIHPSFGVRRLPKEGIFPSSDSRSATISPRSRNDCAKNHRYPDRLKTKEPGRPWLPRPAIVSFRLRGNVSLRSSHKASPFVATSPRLSVRQSSAALRRNSPRDFSGGSAALISPRSSGLSTGCSAPPDARSAGPFVVAADPRPAHP